MQRLKTALAAAVADGHAKTWTHALPMAVDAHNKRPNSVVYGPPETVESRPEQDCRVPQDNARKGLLQEAGAFRAPLAGKIRSFKPRYGDIQLLGGARKGDGNGTVRNRGEGKFLLQQIKPVVPESGKPAGRLTEKNLRRKIRLQERAAGLEEHIREARGKMALSDLERAIRRGLLGLLKVFRPN